MSQSRSRGFRRPSIVVTIGVLALAIGGCGRLDPGAPAADPMGGAEPARELAAGTSDGHRYLIVARGNASPAQVQAAVARAGGQLVRSLPAVGVYAATASSPRFRAAVRADRHVEAIEPMHYVALPEHVRGATLSRDAVADSQHPDPPAAFFDELWGIARVNAPAAWERGVTGSHDTVVAVIDTGIASNHPDLAPNLIYEACFVEDGDHTTGACLPYPSYSFHGTHVAGTVAATFGTGDFSVVGVGPNLGLANYNVFELFDFDGQLELSASFDSVFAAMIDAADRGFDVINMSLGTLVQKGIGPGSDQVAALRTAFKRVADYVRRAGTVVVASTGNAGIDLTGPIINLPGGTQGILNVAATGIRPDPVYPQPGAFDVLASYSNRGAPVDIAAPGGDCGLDDGCDPATRPADWFLYLILSTFVDVDFEVDPAPACAATASCPVGWAFAAGTSMAAPHVSGAAGLLRDQRPGLNPNQVVAVLRRTAEPIGARRAFGHGMVDVDAATR